MTEPLKYEVNRVGDNDIYLYECEHLSTVTAYVTDGFVLNLGEHANLLLCKHCVEHMIGMVNSRNIRAIMEMTANMSDATSSELGDKLHGLFYELPLAK